MGQRKGTLRAIFFTFFLAAFGCDQPAPATPKPAGTTIVSLSPAATDLLIAMGSKERIVGVTPYDTNPALAADLPKVGDYQRIDWERLAQLKPGFLIVQGKRDRLPQGIAERCAGMGIAVISLEIDRFDDILNAVQQIGDAIGKPDDARALRLRMQTTRDSFTTSAARVPAMIVLNEEGTAVVGRGNFIDDALGFAGAVNVIETIGYLTLDREKLRSLKPQVIYYINIKPPLSTEAIEPKGVPVVEITRPDALLPGACVIDLVRDFARPIQTPATQKSNL